MLKRNQYNYKKQTKHKQNTTNLHRIVDVEFVAALQIQCVHEKVERHGETLARRRNVFAVRVGGLIL